MKKTLKTLFAGLTIVGVLSMGFAVSAQDAGAAGAATDTDYTLEEMLTYAIEDEYLAQAEYNAIMGKYGVQRPFSNIIKAEERHIAELLPLFEAYSVAVPENNLAELITVPSTIEESYTTGVSAEEKNIAMYESFLKEELPADVKEVFENLKFASERHLNAVQNSVDGKSKGTGKGSMNGGTGARGNRNISNTAACDGSCS